MLCRFLSQSLCAKLFPTVDHGSLTLNKTVLLQHSPQIGPHQQLVIQQQNRHPLHLNLQIQIAASSLGQTTQPTVDLNRLGSRVTHANTSGTQSEIRVASDASVGVPQILRVENLVTGAQAIGVECEVVRDPIGYLIRVHSTQAVELDQIYAFDVSFDAGALSRRASFYLVRSGDLLWNRRERVRQRFDRLHDNQLVMELTTGNDVPGAG